MKKVVFALLLFLSVNSIAQTPFKLGASYTINYVISYPNPNTLWVALGNFSAKSYPSEGTQWTRYFQPFDVTGLTNRIAVLEKTNSVLQSKIDSIATIKPVDVRFPLKGYPILYIKNDSTWTLQSDITSYIK